MVGKKINSLLQLKNKKEREFNKVVLLVSGSLKGTKLVQTEEADRSACIPSLFFLLLGQNHTILSNCRSKRHCSSVSWHC